MADDFGWAIPGYEIIEKVGEGGMATVWTARQTSLDRVVAIKVLSAELTKSPEAVKRFRSEAQSAAKLRHSGIVQVYDAGEDGNMVYFVMEYVPGFTVQELLERKKVVSEKSALAIADAIALAMQHSVETAGIIHCDIKPANVMIEQDGTVKVADLGLSQVVGSVAFDTGKRDMMGTPNYTSPEQVRGFNDLDCRTDIYSLGAMLYHMVTGELPFASHPPDQILEKQLYGFLPDPKQVNPEISSGVAWLIEKMMIKDRTLRTQNWKEVITDIHEVLNGGVPAGKMPSAGHSTVLRSDERGLEPSATQSIKVSEIAKREAEEAVKEKKPKQKIVLPKDVQQQLKSRRRKKKSSFGPVLARLLGLALLVGCGYGLITYLMRTSDTEPRDLWEEAMGQKRPKPSASDLPPRVVKPGQKKNEAFTPATTVRQTGSSPSSGQAGVKWQNSDFRRGAEAFNRGLRAFQAQQEDHGDPIVLQGVEQDCRTAIDAFEACRSQAPADVDIDKYINQCYHLISDCRQSTLLIPSGKHHRETDIKKRFGQRMAAKRKPTLPAATVAQPKEASLQLAPTWKMGGIKRGQAATDLYALLKNQGHANVDLSGHPSIRILDQVHYLMPLQEACQALGIRIKGRRSLSTGAFPRNSFFYYSASGTFGGGFERLLLLTDNKDQVVGAQLIDDSPDERLLFEPHNYSPDWGIYDFLLGKTKGNAKWRVAHMPRRDGDLIIIDSELVTHDRNGYFELGQTKSRVSLMLPQPIVELVLFMAESNAGR